MRESELWRRLEQHLGATYARAWAASTSLRELDGRTVEEALAAGVDIKRVWEAAWAFLELPFSER